LEKDAPPLHRICAKRSCKEDAQSGIGTAEQN